MIKKRIVIAVLVAIIFLPLWMWLGWLCTPKKKMVAVIVDKTALPNGEQHASFTWVLNNQRFTKTETALYKNDNDYFGFFPLKNEKFRLKGLERFSAQMLEKLSNDADLLYLTDTYGVYKNEWYQNKNEPGLIYGGMSEQDIQLLQKMKEKHKLVISEFNTLGAPTTEKNRSDFENIFGVKWSGWTGCYFASLDTAKNTDLPAWIPNFYKKDNNGQWPFHHAGIVFVNTENKVVILEEGNDLSSALPLILVNKYAQKKYHLPAQTAYPFWFDVMQYDSMINQPIAQFQLEATAAGKQILKNAELPAMFPAILKHEKTDYRFYYFSGNFCDNPISLNTSYFKGIGVINSLFYHSDDVNNRRNFFWNFYRPLMTEITADYYQSLSKN